MEPFLQALCSSCALLITGHPNELWLELTDRIGDPADGTPCHLLTHAATKAKNLGQMASTMEVERLASLGPEAGQLSSVLLPC
jgi:hypothetical protein